MSIQIITTTRAQAWQAMTGTAAAPSEANLRVTGEQGQTWEGWGGCFNELGWVALSALAPAQRQKVLAALFDPEAGCRFNLCRLPIGASDYAAEWYSHNETDGDYAMAHFTIARDQRYLLPYIKEALAHRPDLTLFASPWSPPTWMKFPRAYNYGTLIRTPEMQRAYALYFAKFVQAYQREGVTIHQIHPQNEPVADQKFPSCLWTGAQMRDFIRDYLAPVFAELGVASEIWLGTLNTDDYDGFISTTFSDNAAARAIAGIGLQWAGKGMAQRIHSAWPEKRLLQTENECGEGQNTWEYAHYVFSLLQHYITNGVVGYTYWNMALAPGGLSTWGWRQNAMITVDPQTGQITYNPEFYVMKHCSHFIAPGAVRLTVAGPWAANAVAFENPDGQRVAVVANPLPDARLCVCGDDRQASSVLLPAESFTTMVLG